MKYKAKNGHKTQKSTALHRAIRWGYAFVWIRWGFARSGSASPSGYIGGFGSFLAAKPLHLLRWNYKGICPVCQGARGGPAPKAAGCRSSGGTKSRKRAGRRSLDVFAGTLQKTGRLLLYFQITDRRQSLHARCDQSLLSAGTRGFSPPLLVGILCETNRYPYRPLFSWQTEQIFASAYLSAICIRFKKSYRFSLFQNESEKESARMNGIVSSMRIRHSALNTGFSMARSPVRYSFII